MNFGALEWALVQGITMLAQRDPQRYEKKILPPMFGERLNLFDKMVRREISDSTFIIEHAKIVSRIQTLAGTRNDLIHGPWFDLPNTNIDEVKGKLTKHKMLLAELYGSLQARGVRPIEIEAAMVQAHEMIKIIRDHVEAVRNALPQIRGPFDCQ